MCSFSYCCISWKHFLLLQIFILIITETSATGLHCYPRNVLFQEAGKGSEMGEQSLILHRILKEKCNDISYGHKTVLSADGLFDNPFYMREVFICNITNCIILPYSSNVQVHSKSKPCLEDVRSNPYNNFVIISSNNTILPHFVPLTKEDVDIALRNNSGRYLYNSDNVDSETFIKWFDKLLDALEDKGPHLIVIDNAPYHGATGVAKSSDRKHVMYMWLQEYLPSEELENLKAENLYRKYELWDMVKKEKKTKNFYIIDKKAAEKGHKIVRLSPYGCDLNPIELVWKDVKHAVRKGNTKQTIETVVEIAKNIMDNYDPSYWAAHVGHVKRLEAQYWEQDGFLDQMFDQVSRPDLMVHMDCDDEPDDDDAIGVDPDIIQSTVHDADVMALDEDDLLDV